MSEALWRAFCAVDDRLASQTFHRTSGWWADAIKSWYLHPTAMDLVACVGRGGAKSFTSTKTLLTEVVYGEFSIPPGEVHYGVFVSARHDEALERIRLVEAMLTALEVPFDRSKEVITLGGRYTGRGFRSLSASVGAVSGYRCLGYSLDEASKHFSNGVNPSREVAASLDAMCVTHPNARRRLISSPMGRTGYFFERCEQGSDEHQVHVQGSSWKANPDGITEERCRKLAKGDSRVFDREYRALPQQAINSAFDGEDIDRCFRTDLGDLEYAGAPVLLTDAAGKGSDAWTACIATWVRKARVPEVLTEPVYDPRTGELSHYRNLYDQHGRMVRNPAYEAEREPHLLLSHWVAFDGPVRQRVPYSQLVKTLANHAKSYGAGSVVADQHTAYSLADSFRGHKLPFTDLPFTNENKIEAVARIRKWMRDGKLLIQAGDLQDRVAGELRSFEEKITDSGTIRYEGRHDDCAALLILSSLATDARLLRGAPHVPSHTRTVQEETHFQFG